MRVHAAFIQALEEVPGCTLTCHKTASPQRTQLTRQHHITQIAYRRAKNGMTNPSGPNMRGEP
jgi:hypothetical protein